MKRKAKILAIVIILLMSVMRIYSWAVDGVSGQDYIAQSDINSKQYLVTDNCISRISPSTMVETFVEQLGLEGKKVIIYSDSSKTKEITEGLISTGMVADVEGLDTDYELSVIGDVNGDGLANIVDAVKIINHLAKIPGGEFQGLKLISGDWNEDGQVDGTDANKVIRYIVFGELEVGEVEAPIEPTITEEGTANNGWYKENTKVSINTQEEKFLKTVYKVDGEKFETTNDKEETTLEESGIYEISAYTYGARGNKSKMVQKEIKIDKEAPVIESINKSLQGENNETIKVEIKANDVLSGLAEEAYSFNGGVTWQKEAYKTFEQNSGEIEICVRDNAGNIQTAEENIVTKFQVVFKNDNGNMLQEEELAYGAVPEYTGKIPMKYEDETYTYTFAGWDKEITAVTQSIEYIAVYDKTYKNYEITFENDDGSIISQKLDYHYGDTITIPENPIKEIPGYIYTFEKWIPGVKETVDGNATYIATYKEEIVEYTINYQLDGGIVEGNPTSYNVETETFTLNNPTRENYTFLGWTLDDSQELMKNVTIEKGSTGDRTYTANWKLNHSAAMIKETGKIYGSIYMALQEHENGQTIILLDNLTESVEIGEGVEVIIDLDGYSLTNVEGAQNTITNKGNLKIVDTNEKTQGSINNTSNYAIKNETNAIFTLGEIADEVKEYPYIVGKENGVKNEGIFNFYDGRIEANEAINGDVNDTPVNYNVVMETKEEDSTIQVAHLGIMADSVARIGNVYYTSLEKAINSLEDEEIENAKLYEKYNKENLILQLDGEKNQVSGWDEFSTTWQDISGVSNTEATIAAGTAVCDGNAIVLDGLTYLNLPAAKNTTFSSGTVEVCVKILPDFKPVSTDNWYNASCIIGCELGGSNKDGGVLIDKNGNFAVGYYNTVSRKETMVSSTINALDGKPHTISYSYTEEGIKFYVDGKLIVGDIFTPSGTAISTLGIGWNKSGTATKIKGNIYSIRYYDNELTEEKILENYAVDKERIIETKDAQRPEQQTTITLVKDIALSNPVIVKNYMNVALDLNGRTLSTNNANYLLRNRGKLEILDTSLEKIGNITSNAAQVIIYNNDGADLDIKEVSLSNEKNGTSSKYNRVIDNEGNLKVNGTTISSNAQYMHLISNYNNLNIIDGTLSTKNRDSRCAYNAGNVEISGGMLNTNSSSNSTLLENVDRGVVNINAGTLTSEKKYYAIENNGKMTINEGTINGTRVVYNKASGKLTVNGGTFESRYDTIYHDSTADLTITRGNFTSTDNGGYAIRNLQTGNVTITGGNFTTNGNNSYAIGNQQTGNINISGGTFISQKSYSVYNGSTGNINITGGNLTSNSDIAVYNVSTGAIVIGNKEAELSSENPYIYGKTYGIYNMADGNVKFYNGKIAGGTKFIYGTIGALRENCKLKIEYDDTNNEIATLTENLNEAVVKYNGNTYSSISEAMKVITDNEVKEESTITLIKDNIIDRSVEKIVIPEGYNVVIDLAGYNIRNCICSSIIENNGTLKITGNNGEGNTIKTSYSNAIYNLGTLNYEKGNMKIDITAANETVAGIYNTGILNVTDLSIDMIINSQVLKNEKRGCIYNEGTLAIDNIVININNKDSMAVSGIYNTNKIETIKTGSITVKYGTAAIYNTEDGEISTIGDTENTLEILSNGWTSYGLYNLGNVIQIEANTTITGQSAYSGYQGGATYGVYNEETGKIDIIKGKVNRLGGGNQATLYNEGTIEKIEGDISQSNGDLWTKDCKAIENIGTINFVQGNILTAQNGILNSGTIENVTGDINATKCGILNSGKINNLNSEKVYAPNRAIENTGTITINGGNIGQDGTLVSQYGIYNTAGEKVVINNATITGTNYGIYNNGTTTFEINSGNVISTTGVGIQNDSASGVVTLGRNDEATNPTTYPDENQENKYPTITGITYGVYSTGTFNFYDGIIFANETSRNTISGSINNTSDVYGEGNKTEEVYNVLYKDTEGKHYAILGREVASQILDVEGNVLGEYYTLAKAVDAYQNDTGIVDEYKVKMLRSVDIKETDEAIAIDEEANVILDLNGHQISSANELLIENNGNLSIVDESVEKTGAMITTNARIINNKGTLNIDDIDMLMDVAKSNVDVSIIENTETLNVIKANMELNITGESNNIATINNTGTLNITDLSIDMHTKSGGTGDVSQAAIYNNGILTIDNIVININNDNKVVISGIYNMNKIENIKTGSVTVKNGTAAIYNTVDGEITTIGDTENSLEILSSSVAAYGVYNLGKITQIETNATITGFMSGWGAWGGTAYGVYNDETGEIDTIKGKVNRTGSCNQAALYNKGTIDKIEGDIKQYDYESVYTSDCKAIDNIGIINSVQGNITAQKGIKNSGIIGKITGNINADVTGIVNTGTIDSLNSEMVYGSNRGIENTGTITINAGTIGKNGSLISTYGIYNSDTATFNYSGGEIYGKPNPVLGIISSIPEGKEILRQLGEDGVHSKFYLEASSPVASIGETQYNTLNGAIEASSESNNTIKLLKDIIQIENINIDEDKDIVIDLNGFDIDSYTPNYLINNNGKLLLTNTTENESKITSACGVVQNTSEVTINNISMDITLEGTSSNYKNILLNNSEDAVMNIENIMIDSSLIYIHAINNTLGTLNYNGGTITLRGKRSRIIYNAGQVNINGGEFTITVNDENYIIHNVSSGNVEINDGIMNTTSYVIVNYDQSTITIKGGNLNSSGRDIIYHNSTGDARIEAGTFVSTGSGIHMIRNVGKGNITITGGEFTAEKNNIYVIYNQNTGNINIEGGTITHISNIAIYNNSTGTITVGKDDNKVETNNPIIKSNTNYGIYNNNASGKIKFYDGAIIGKLGAVYGSISEMASGYNINTEIIDIDDIVGLERYTLTLDGTVSSGASVNGIFYKSLQEAINACGNNETTITLQNSINIEEVITIAQGQNIILDLNGHTITGTIENNGILTIKNSKGAIEEGSYGTITGNGTINIGT